MNHIVHFKVKKKFHAPCGWEILPENYLQQAISFAPEGFTQSMCEICQWNVGLKWLVAPSHQLAFTGVQPE